MRKYFTKSLLLFLVALFIFVPNSRALENNDADSNIDAQSIKKVIPNDLPTPICGHKLIGGIGNVTIYIDSAGTPRATYWQRLIKDAVTNWMYTGVGANKFYGSYVTNASSSKVEIEAVYKGYFGAADADRVHAATARIYQKKLVGNPPKTDWDHSVIMLNDDVLRRPSISDEEATGDIIHEIGHVFGLEHNNVNPYSIMHSTSVIDTKGNEIFRKVHKVQKVDNDAVNRIY